MTRSRWLSRNTAASLLFIASPMTLQAETPPTAVIELRQYTLHPEQRDVLIELFEREFIESQEALGMTIIGTFRDLDDPDRFVWIRGFEDMASRAQALNAFYSGPVWQAHRDAANATMIDSDNVLLLHVVRADSGFTSGPRTRPPKGTSERPKGLTLATIYYSETPVGPDFIDFFERSVSPVLKRAGISVRAIYVSETSPNNFPRLPVREREHVLVWFSTYADLREYEQCLSRLKQSAEWTSVLRTLQLRLKEPPEVHRLQPTPRSALRE